MIISRGEYAMRNGAPAPQGLPPLEKVKFISLDLNKAWPIRKS